MGILGNILISDSTLRDGNHAIKHQLTLHQIAEYARAIDKTGIDIVEVGHGNGLGASSVQLGELAYSTPKLLACARDNLQNAKLGIHVIPGVGRKSDIEMAIDLGVDVFRVASHCSEANTTEKHIEFLNSMDKIVYGVLMMSHMLDAKSLLSQAQLLKSYGVSGIIIMDSAGAYLMSDVKERISLLVNELEMDIGFHAHNNLGLAIANSLIAIEAGATIIDGTAKGFGAGAGNAALEILVAVLQKVGVAEHINLIDLLDVSDSSINLLMDHVPYTSSTNIVSGLYGVFSGFDTRVCKLSEEYGVDPKAVFKALGLKRVIAGQEDIILEVVKQLAGDVE